MAYLLGTDEAGYGPNLGPLVVSATLWQVPDDCACVDLYAPLRGAVSAKPTDPTDSPAVPIADSKVLYKAGGGLERLELGVLTTLAAAGTIPRTWRELWARVDPESDGDRRELPWYQGYDRPLPVATSRDQIERLAHRLDEALRRASMKVCSIKSAAIYPARLNRLIDQLGSKGSALSMVTLDLVERMLGQVSQEPVLVVCDKHGGRNRYGRLLQEQFPTYVVEVYGEGRAESIYRMGPPDRRVEIQFRAKGEAFLPSALASMVSKYLRELSMAAFNGFWQQRAPQLRPTAGYPPDARRFKREIVHMQRNLAIEDRVLWRSR